MIRGSLVAIITPMHEDGTLDLDAYRRLIEWHITEGTHAIVAVGTTGESPTVDFDEHNELIRVAVETARKRVPVIAGTGGNSTAEAIELTRYAKKVGADATLQVVPYYNKPTQEGMKVAGVPGQPKDGRIYTVTDLTDTIAVLDGNHPLAGRALRFVITVRAVAKASEEELAQAEAPITPDFLRPVARRDLHHGKRHKH